jgi:flagellar biosynthesis protein FlhA
LVKELVPDLLTVGTVNTVLQGFLKEQIPIVDIRTIVETLAEAATKTKDYNELLTTVRVALSKMITQRIVNLDTDLPIITLQPDLEGLLINAVNSGDKGGAGIEPNMAENLQQSLQTVYKQQEQANQPAVLVVQPSIRSMLARFVRNISSNMHVLSYHEIPDNKQVRIVGTVG